MFKAKLIENEKYYKLQRKQLFLTILLFIQIYLFVSFYKIPIWVTILIIGIFVATVIFTSRNQKRINSILGNKLIEIDMDEIRINSKNGATEESIKLDEVERMILKNEYSIPQETLKEMGQELTGNIKQNFIILYKDSQKRQFDFEIDSYYMINQLNKLIETWRTKGYKIETI